MQPRFQLSPLGLLINENGVNVVFAGIDETEVSVPHLREHVISFALPKGDVFHVKIVYACHCWTRSFDPETDQDRMIIWDHRRPRVHCPKRYGASFSLKEMLESLAKHAIYNASSRNYGAFNATVKTQNGEFYTAFFTMRGSVVAGTDSATDF